MQSHFDLTDNAFEQAFRTCSLPPALFTHEAHLRLAWIHLRKEQPSIAIEAVRVQIIAFVEQLGAQDKYHETLTVAAIRIVHHFMNKTKSYQFNCEMTQIELKLLQIDQGGKRGRSIATAEFTNAEQVVRNEFYQSYYS